ncbi:hypothetical protein F5141DRAFT_1082479 [Pisolithus sp. B1]|nr:hypothetical protein F5141DRAFT_1082479 [Pisolithus sp. B1]
MIYLMITASTFMKLDYTNVFHMVPKAFWYLWLACSPTLHVMVSLPFAVSPPESGNFYVAWMSGRANLANQRLRYVLAPLWCHVLYIRRFFQTLHTSECVGYNLAYIAIALTPTRRMAAPVKMSRTRCLKRRQNTYISAPFHLIYVRTHRRFILLPPLFISPTTTTNYFTLVYLPHFSLGTRIR